MPELPEVETLRLGLEKLIVGKTVSSLNVINPTSMRSSANDVERFLVGATVNELDRRGKLLIIHLSTSYTLLVHLRMTGQMVYVDDSQRYGAGHPNDSLVARLPDRSTRIVCHFDDGAVLYFNDQRKFGYWSLAPTNLVNEDAFVASLGPEPLDETFTAKDFKIRLARRKGTTIKAAILDQSVLAGVGNIYADESLFMVGLHPATRVGSVSQKTIEALRGAITEVMQISINHGGSSDKNYVNAEGKKGSYLTFAQVFRREGKSCPVCGTTIEKIRVAGRGTHVCPQCQKPPSKRKSAK